MSRWFRFYDGVLDDPKAQRLPPVLFKAWVNLMCLASRNDGNIPIGDVAFALRVTDEVATETIGALVAAGLIDEFDGLFSPHNWDARQFKSDSEDPTAAERMRRYRSKSRNGDPTSERNADRNATVTVTVPRTEQNRTEKKEDMGASRPLADEKFEEFRKAYPRRQGANPWKPAKAQWDAAVKSGSSPDKIIAAVKAGVGYDTAKINTEYIPQAVKWLRDRRFDDYAPPDNVVPLGFYAAADTPERDAWNEHWRATRQINLPRDKNGGWYVPARWPPGYEQSATG